MLWGEEAERQRLMKDYELIKQQVNLTEVAAHFGYEIIRKESSRNCVMMKYGHHKIAITRDQDGHYIYYTIGDSLKTDCGSVIDYVINRKQCEFQDAVKWLKQWQNIPLNDRPRRETYVSKIETSSKDTQSVIKSLVRMQLASEMPYLSSRGITKESLTSPRFHGRIYKDSRNNVVFPHYANGVTGYELKNFDFVGFSPNGEKALWFSNAEKTDQTLVIAESAIDAISYSILYPDTSDRTRYASIGGAMSPKAKDLLHKAAKDFPGQHITLAFDNDDGGKAITQEVQNLLADTGKEISIHLSENKDFNDDLKAKLGLLDKQTRPRYKPSSDRER